MRDNLSREAERAFEDEPPTRLRGPWWALVIPLLGLVGLWVGMWVWLR